MQPGAELGLILGLSGALLIASAIPALAILWRERQQKRRLERVLGSQNNTTFWKVWRSTVPVTMDMANSNAGSSPPAEVAAAGV